jgi:hypothetical protein
VTTLPELKRHHGKGGGGIALLLHIQKISVQKPGYLTQVFHVFPQSAQANSGIISQLDDDRIH